MRTGKPETVGEAVLAIVTLGTSMLIKDYKLYNAAHSAPASGTTLTTADRGAGSLSVASTDNKLTVHEDRRELHHVEVHTITTKYSGNSSTQVVKK